MQELALEVTDGLSANQIDYDYQCLMKDILFNGEERADRTGVGTIGIFGANLRIELSQGFPLLTTKKVGFKSVASELLWFIEGSGDERRLAEILHGTRDSSKKTIWSPNAAGTTGAKFQPEYEGDLGRVYGVQWRSWKRYVSAGFETYANADSSTGDLAYTEQKSLDQLADVIHKLRTNPTDRRIILSAWNPGELDQMALPPCHMFAQFYLSNDRRLSCSMYQRSVDTFLGLPFNIASYALLTHLIAHVIGADVGVLTMSLGDTHIYKNHLEQVKEQLTREPFALSNLVFNREVKEIDDFKMADFDIVGYQSHDSISAPMAA